MERKKRWTQNTLERHSHIYFYGVIKIADTP